MSKELVCSSLLTKGLSGVAEPSWGGRRVPSPRTGLCGWETPQSDAEIPWDSAFPCLLPCRAGLFSPSPAQPGGNAGLHSPVPNV